MYLAYEVFFYLVFVLFIPWYVLAGMFRGKPRFILGKLSWFQDAGGEHDVWIHAVSVGEVAAARAVVDHLVEMRPALRILITSTTVTGRAMAARLFPGLTIAHFPFDMTWVVRRFLRHYRPRVYATMETEIWPTVSRVVGASGVRMLLANGRISDHSYPRYRLIRFMLRHVLSEYDVILARDETDRDRFIQIGAPSDRVEVAGNVKFDFEADRTPLAFASRLESLVRGRRIFIAGSTVEGEEEMLTPTIREIVSRDVFVVVAPRKPERFDAVAGALEEAGLRWIRRTRIDEPVEGADVLLLDTIGELPKVFRWGTAAFIGGSLVPRGGHNPIEPAAVGTPVAFGPFMSNFREVAATLLDMRAAVQVDSPAALLDFVVRMTTHTSEHREYSARCLDAVHKNRGAAHRTASRIVDLLG